MTDLAKQLRAVIRRSGLTRHAISKRGGIPYAAVFEFVAGGDCRLRTASRILDAIGIEIRFEPKKNRKGGQ